MYIEEAKCHGLGDLNVFEMFLYSTTGQEQFYMSTGQEQYKPINWFGTILIAIKWLGKTLFFLTGQGRFYIPCNFVEIKGLVLCNEQFKRKSENDKSNHVRGYAHNLNNSKLET